MNIAGATIANISAIAKARNRRRNRPRRGLPRSTTGRFGVVVLTRRQRTAAPASSARPYCKRDGYFSDPAATAAGATNFSTNSLNSGCRKSAPNLNCFISAKARAPGHPSIDMR